MSHATHANAALTPRARLRLARLIVDHGWQRGVGLATIYNHATHYVVGVGEHVNRGQLVGYVGSTGWSTGCHLHFTVMANGVAVDPMRWF